MTAVRETHVEMDHVKLRELLRSLPNLPEHLQFLRNDEPEFTDVGDGNLNDVIRISRKSYPTKSVILKYAPPFIKCQGPEYPLSQSRNILEYKALEKFHEICTGLVPQPYCCPKDEYFVLMEDLLGYRDMRKELVEGKLDMGVVVDIADFTMKLHKNTHRKRMQTESFNKLIDDFKNDEMVELTNQFVFTKPFQRDDPTNRSSEEVKRLFPLVYEDENLLRKVEELRKKFVSQRECLLHGDLHTGSVMTKGCHAKVIDAEFTYVGPAGFDIGMFLANLVFSYHAHRCYPLTDGTRFHEKIKTAILKTTKHYFDGMSEWLEETDLRALVSETTGFLGCELLRRILGTAHVIDVEGKPDAEVACVKLGVELILKHQEVKTVDVLTERLQMN